MSDALIFGGFFAGLFVLRAIVATIVFFLVIPEGDRCPYCDSATLRVHRPRLARVLPFVRASWCYECGWEGWLRSGAVTAPRDTPARVASPTP
ncbi:MAG TPA: hypothetical protein VFZ11_12310 [Gemmatimonadaceae bacterium]